MLIVIYLLYVHKTKKLGYHVPYLSYVNYGIVGYLALIDIPVLLFLFGSFNAQ